MTEWSPCSIEDAGWTTSSSPSPAAKTAPRTYRRRQPPPVAAGYSSPLTPHASRMLGERGDERVPERTRSEGRRLSGVPEEAVSTSLPEATSFDHGVGLPSHAGEDVLLSLLANRGGLNAKRVLLQGHGSGELGGGGKQHAGSGGVEESKGAPPYDTTAGGGSGGIFWSLGPSGRGVPLGLVSRLATWEDVDAALHEMRPSHLRPDMPPYHAKDLRVPSTFRKARDGEHGAQFMDAAKREVFGLLEAGTFKIVDE